MGAKFRHRAKEKTHARVARSSRAAAASAGFTSMAVISGVASVMTLHTEAPRNTMPESMHFAGIEDY